MKKIRKNVFETNSSSTHSLTCVEAQKDYLPRSSKIVIKFTNTNDDYSYATLSEKVSYLVSHIINSYKYECEDYEDLKEQVEDNWEFKDLKAKVLDRFGKEVVLPKVYKGDIEEIVEINHQLVKNTLDDVLRDIVVYERDYLSEVLSENQVIHLGRD